MKRILSLLSLFVLILNLGACDNPAKDFDRHPAQIHYSKHAKCRMVCRHIDESEVGEILGNGTFNFAKSELNTDACHKRYALEGYSHDHQKIRIIVAECNRNLSVITVIDLNRDWPCTCD